MTTDRAPALRRAGTPTQATRAVVLLGWHEGRRMLTRPVYLFIVAALLLSGIGGIDNLGSAEVHYLGAALMMYGALATLFAASLVATSARRSGAEALFGAAPLDPQLRTLATGLGVLLGPVAVASLLTIGLAVVDHVFDPVLDATTLTGWEYVQLPLIWLGAGLLGVSLARWLPWPGVPLAACVALIAWTLWSADLVDTGHSAGFLMPFVITSQEVFGLQNGPPMGQLGWHAGYLLGLCLLALTAALLSHRPLRQRAVVGFGVLAAVQTVSAAWLQLP